MSESSAWSTTWQRVADQLLQSNAENKADQRQGRLAALIILLSSFLTFLVLSINLTGGAVQGDVVGYLLRGGLLLAFLGVLYVINRRGLTRLAGIGMSLYALGLAFALLITTGPLTPNAIVLIIPVIIAGLFGPPASAILIAILTSVIYALVNLYEDPDYFLQGGTAIQTLLVYFNLAFVAVVAWLFSRMTRQALDETEELSLALVSQRQEMEDRLLLQTQQLQATTTVARAIVGSRDLNVLLEDIVRLVRETFDYYHVQVFLVDEENQYAVLQQSTGEVGQQLLAKGHRLAVGSLSVIGQVTASGRPVLAGDADANILHRRNELLPHTRSELAIPLMIGDRVIGALDMQSVDANAFDEEMLPTFQALADQLAVAIENARLFEQAEANLREFRDLSRDVTQRSWAEFLAETREEERRQYYGPEPKALQVHRSRVIERVLSAGSVVVSSGKDGRQAFIAAPVVVRNEVIGVLGVEPDGMREWTQEDLTLLQGIAERTAAAVENARLYMQAQHAADRERLISTISARLQRAPSLALLLESAAKELAEALGTDNVYAEISLERPLAYSQQTSGQSSPGEGKAAEARHTESKDLTAPGSEPEEARAEL